MKPEDQVCSLEFSKKLKFIGIKQDSLFYWENPYNYEVCYHSLLKDNNELYSAFLPNELLKILPHKIDNFELKIIKNYDGFTSYYQDASRSIIYETDKNLSNSLCKVIIHIIENKVMVKK